MLVLQRSVNSRVFLYLPNGETIVIMVTETSREHCKLGFIAPSNVSIVREEAKSLLKKDRTLKVKEQEI